MAKIVILGPPGCGKGTQAELISDEFGWPQISTGNILRHAIEAKTALGKEAKSYMDRGELVPDDVVDGIVKERLSQSDCLGGFLLDGFPRDLAQAETLERISPPDMVFNVTVPDDVLVERLSGRRVCDCGQTYHITYNPPKRPGICDRCQKRIFQRKDDREATIRQRLSVYHRQTEPLIRHYLDRGILYKIDGTKNIRDVHRDIKARLG
jgi:adenylate kinase